jgi:hypothetical protein
LHAIKTQPRPNYFKNSISIPLVVVFKNGAYIICFSIRCIVILQYKYIAMGITKTEYFTEEQNELAILAKALNLRVLL